MSKSQRSKRKKIKRLKLKGREPERILVVRLDRLGDVILSTPVIKALRDAYPDSRIALMVRPYAREAVDGNPYLNEVIVYDKDGAERGIAGNIKFISALRRRKFDTAIILHPTARTHILAALSGIPRRIGYDRKLGFLLTKRIPHTKHYGLKHETEYALDLLRHIGLEAKDRQPYMPVDNDSERRIEELFRAEGVKGGDICVAVNPGASCRSKRWDAVKFARCAGSIIEKYGAKIVVMAGGQDKELGDKVASLLSRNCINLSGRTRISDVASVLRRSALFISNDSGPVHIASAVGTPVIAIFGRSDRGLSPRRWGPTGKRDVVLHKDVGCEKCAAHDCELGFKCLEAVTVDDVIHAADKILGAK